MLKFGMPTLIEAADIASCAALCHELGLDFIELNMNLPQYQPDAVDTDRLGQLGEQYGIGYTIHLDENMDACEFNPYVADAYLRTVKESIALAKKLRAPLLNMHLSRGVYFTLPQGKVYLYAQYKEQYLQKIAAFRDACECEIGKSDIKICIENCSGWQDFQKDAIDVLLASPVFALTLDVGHNHGSGGEDGAFILSRKERLQHMHLHDAQGKKDHLALGTGEVDIPYYLTLAGEVCQTVVLESKTIASLRASVAALSSLSSTPR